MKKILLIDDEKNIVDFISYNLINEGFAVSIAYNGAEGIELAKKIIPDLILLDIMMPLMDGFETCKRLKKIKELQHTVIVFLSAKSEDISQIEAFNVGASDFVVKNVKIKLLIKKISALLNLAKSNPKQEAINPSFQDCEEVSVDLDTYRMTLEGNEFILPKKEFELIYLLISNTKKVFRREEIMEIVWGNDVVVGDRTIDVHIRKLREKIGNDKIVTVKGVGYKYVTKK